ncbi:MAG: VWA domain-containing protein [bacterium]|nr:VWA domain-containing protein [bacterium]
MRLLIAIICGAMSLTAATTGNAADVWVRIATPVDGAYAIGDVEIVAKVMAAEPVESVEFRVDGRTVGLVTSPPYSMHVDLGGENTAHTFEVIARCTTGGQASDSVTTKPVPIAHEVEVELQQLYVTVTERGARVLDLRPENFEVIDERTPQKLVTFERGDVPLTAVLLIDSSDSMAGDKLRAAMQGAVAFVENMEKLDQAKLMFFSDRLLNTTEFFNADAMDSSRLAITRATGGTALHDYLYVALKLIEQRQGRRVVIILSDGVDTHSTLDMVAVADLARRSQAQIHWIRPLRGSTAEADDETVRITSNWRSASEFQDQIELLKRTVKRSGGGIHFIDNIDQIETIFLGILRELREQYVLGYYPSDRRNDGAWHKVRIKVVRPDVKVRAAAGYIDY